KKQIWELRQQVFKYLIERNSQKYKSFLRYLRIFKYVSLSPNRGNFLELYYVLMRYLDDIADGDLPSPAEYENNVQYIQSKIDFAVNPINPKDDIDRLMLHCFELAQKFESDFKKETHDILNSLLFDANRLGSSRVFPREELMKHFHIMDIRGTIRATLKVFNDNPDNYKLLESLGLATRIHYDLQDFESDIRAGYVNIPMEDIVDFNIKIEEVDDRYSDNVYLWFIQEAKHGLNLLKEHKKKLQQGQFSLLARATFPLVYVNPAKKYFKKVLKEFPEEPLKKIDDNYITYQS
ncbi:MAG: class 1 isoprenoid biosynthesis enzyme, partial [Bacteroidota bacterium]